MKNSGVELDKQKPTGGGGQHELKRQPDKTKTFSIPKNPKRTHRKETVAAINAFLKTKLEEAETLEEEKD